MSTVASAIPDLARLDRRITLQRFTTTQDETGDVIEAWTDLAEVWAMVEPLQGLERLQAAQMTAIVDTRFTIRYRADLAAGANRVVFDGKPYNIQAVIELGRREALQLEGQWADAPTAGNQARARTILRGPA